jgi:hypothetical protein
MWVVRETSDIVIRIGAAEMVQHQKGVEIL